MSAEVFYRAMGLPGTSPPMTINGQPMIRYLHFNRDFGIKRRCVFLDRDGTLTVYRGFITEPTQLQLIPGVAEVLRELRSVGWLCVLVTNQSAIGRGMLTESGLEEIHAELVRQLTAEGVTLDAIYWCPDKPSDPDETVIENSDRKPGPGMLLAAAKDLNVDLTSSWMIGDRLSDVLAGINAGCRSIRVESGFDYSGQVTEASNGHMTMKTLREAATFILSNPNQS